MYTNKEYEFARIEAHEFTRVHEGSFVRIRELNIRVYS